MSLKPPQIRFLRSLVSTLAIAGCSHNIVPDALQSKTPWPQNITVEIRKVAPQQWRLDYQIQPAMEFMAFEQQMHRFRVGNWNSLSQDWLITECSGKECVRRVDGKAFDHVSLSFGADVERFYDYYPFSISFSDGSRAFYTGHFLLHGNPKTKFRFIPLPNEGVVLNSRVSHEAFEWESAGDLNSFGSFVYFGNLSPQAGRYFDALVDPKLISPLQEILSQRLPKSLSYLENETGIRVLKKPFVIVSQGSEPLMKHRFMANASDQWVLLDLQGIDWRTPSEVTSYKFFNALSHELSHLWTTQTRADLYRVAWLNEGGADYFADHLDSKFNMQNAQMRTQKWKEAQESCRSIRLQFPERILAEPSANEDSGAGYRCGLIVHRAVERLLSRELKPRKFASFWGELLRRAHGGTYGAREYFGLAHEWIHSPDIDFVERFVTAPNRDTQGDSEKLKKVFGL